VSQRERQRQDLADARTRLVSHLQAVLGPSLSLQQAQSALEEAKAWGPVQARELDEHFRQYPTALTGPPSRCPASLVRLLHRLDATGYRGMVTLPRCARCQRTKARLNRVLPEGRCCNDCVPRPLHTCARCGQLRGAQATVDGGHICQSCYTTPTRTCGICGRSRPIVVRASDGQPAVCATCYRGPTGQCAGCGRTRPGSRTAGVFHCSTCRPRPATPCADCGRNKPVQAHWPAGPLCEPFRVRWRLDSLRGSSHGTSLPLSR
jgi:hypothetical protein